MNIRAQTTLPMRTAFVGTHPSLLGKPKFSQKMIKSFLYARYTSYVYNKIYVR